MNRLENGDRRDSSKRLERMCNIYENHLKIQKRLFKNDMQERTKVSESFEYLYEKYHEEEHEWKLFLGHAPEILRDTSFLHIRRIEIENLLNRTVVGNANLLVKKYQELMEEKERTCPKRSASGISIVGDV